MYRSLFFVVTLFFSLSVFSQYQVTFVIKDLPSYHKAGDPIFMAGSFNNWNPGQKNAQLETDAGGRYSLTIAAPAGRYELKFTRGSWSTVEVDAKGAATPNRVIDISGNTTIEISIANWADHFPAAPKTSTASNNVKIISTSFHIPELNRSRRIWIYLPASYQESRKKYPVLYMHDGQNVFEDSTSFSGEWGVDEALDSLGKVYGETIVVAIDNGGDKRMNEYSPFDMEKYGKAEGDQYADFLVNTLRPYINKNYRTKKCRKHTAVAGSSMGGLISLYVMLKYPKKIGAAGVFSPAFWIVPGLKQTVTERAGKLKGKIYFMAGMQESPTMVPDMLAVFQEADRQSKAKMVSVIRAEGKHNEATWRKEFPLFYIWLRR